MRMASVSIVELLLHLINVIFAVIALVGSIYVWTRILYKPFKRILGVYALSIFFMALRSICGSLARLDVRYTDTIIYNFFWALFGALAFSFSIYGSWLLLKWLKKYSFGGVKK